MKVVNITDNEVTIALDPADCKALARVCEVGAEHTWYCRGDVPTACLYTGLASLFTGVGFAAHALHSVPAEAPREDVDFVAFVRYYDRSEPPAA